MNTYEKLENISRHLCNLGRIGIELQGFGSYFGLRKYGLVKYLNILNIEYVGHFIQPWNCGGEHDGGQSLRG